MNRPEVRIIQNQEEQTQPANIDSWEAEQVDNGLTFEQMVAQEESRLKEEEMRRRARMNGPKPTTFDGNRGYDSEVKYSSDDDTGFGFKIEITTDMKLPKY